MGTPDIPLGLDEALTPIGAEALIALWERAQTAREGLRPLVLLDGFLGRRHLGDTLLDLRLGVRDGLLLRCFDCNFGSRLPVFDRCPACDQAVEFELDAMTLVERQREGALARVEWSSGDWRVLARPLTTRDLMAVHSLAPERPSVGLFRRVLEQVDRRGQTIAANDVPELVLDELASRCADADPLSDISLEPSCPACGHRWESSLDIADFVWREVSFHARRLLAQVHVLASVYGWSESTILGLSPARRGVYLGLVESEPVQVVGAA